MQLYQWLSSVADDRGSAKAVVYRDNYLSWRGLLHRVDRRAQEFKRWASAGRVGRAHARQRPRLRDPGAGAVEARRRGRADRSDDRRPRAGDDPRRGAAARAGHPPARRRGRAGRRRPALLRGAARGAPAGRAAVEVRARDPPPAAGHAADVQRVQARAAGEPGRRGPRCDRGRAVHRVAGRRSQGRAQDRRQPGRGRAGDRQRWA